jgi:hypothetical protein
MQPGQMPKLRALGTLIKENMKLCIQNITPDPQRHQYDILCGNIRKYIISNRNNYKL